MFTITADTAKIIAATRAESGALIMADYHGSLLEDHGPVSIIGRSARGTGRFDLRTEFGGVLRGARAASFTLA